MTVTVNRNPSADQALLAVTLTLALTRRYSLSPNPSAEQALLGVLEDATSLLELLSRPEVP